MKIPRYLAMTAAEMEKTVPLPRFCGYMACHFSPYGTGLSNLPRFLPPGAVLMVNDRIPYFRHNTAHITDQLQAAAQALEIRAVVLDFQREGVAPVQRLGAALSGALPCPVVVSQKYARELEGPVLLEPCPHTLPLGEHVSRWQGRELWLDLAVDAMTLTVTRDGTTTVPAPSGEIPAGGHREGQLHCHYSIEANPHAVRFTLWRTAEDLEELAAEAETLGVQALMGLYREQLTVAASGR